MSSPRTAGEPRLTIEQIGAIVGDLAFASRGRYRQITPDRMRAACTLAAGMARPAPAPMPIWRAVESALTVNEFCRLHADESEGGLA